MVLGHLYINCSRPISDVSVTPPHRFQRAPREFYQLTGPQKCMPQDRHIPLIARSRRESGVAMCIFNHTVRPNNRYCAAAPLISPKYLTIFLGSLCNLSRGLQLHLSPGYVKIKSYEQFKITIFTISWRLNILKKMTFAFSIFALICKRLELECSIS